MVHTDSDNNEALNGENPHNYETEEQRRQKDIEVVNSVFLTYKRNLEFKIVIAFAIIFLLILEVVFNKSIYETFEIGLIKNI